MDQKQIDAFWEKVDIRSSVKECWIWMGAKKPRGYGNVRIDKRYLLAHRVSFQIVNGKIPDGLIVCHTCDNPSCCNPHHLMLGTTRSNAVDMLIKNRQKKAESSARGSQNGMAKLSDDNVAEIRSLYRSGAFNQYELAEKFDVSQPCIGMIIRNRTWRHVA